MKTQNFYSLDIDTEHLHVETRYYRFLKQAYDVLVRCGAINMAYCTFTLQFKKDKKNSTFTKTTSIGMNWRYALKECKLILKP